MVTALRLGEPAYVVFVEQKKFYLNGYRLAQAEGLLSIDDPILSFFPDETPENLSENLKSVCILNLLKMNSGHNQEPRYVCQNTV